MSNRLSGNSSLAYVGTNANNPPNLIYATSNPTVNNFSNVSLGDLWLNTSNEEVWILVSLFGTLTSGGSKATWAQLGVMTSSLETLTANSGGAISPNGSNTIFVQGDGTTITIIGNSATNTLTASLVPGSFTATVTGNSGGAVSPNGSGNLNIVGDGTTITIAGNPGTHTLTASVINSVAITLTGNSGGAVSASAGNINVVGDGTTITITGTPGTHTLTASIVSGGALDTLTGDSGGAVSPNGSGNISILGTPGLITVVGNPGAHSLTINAGSTVATTYTADSGSATPSANVLRVIGGTNINTSGSGNTITTNLNTTLTGITNLTVNNLTVNNSATFGYLTQGVVQSNGSGVITSSEGTDGQVLISSSAGAPAWATLTAGSNITITNGHNSISIAASGGGAGSGIVLLATQDMTGLNSFTFTGLVSSTYRTYLLVADKLQVTVGGASQMSVWYFPHAAFSGFNFSNGGINYSTYNSTSVSNINTGTGTGPYYVAPLFGTGNPQYVSFNVWMYNLAEGPISTVLNYGKLATGQVTVYTGTTLYQGVISGWAGSTSGTVPAVTDIFFSAGATVASGTIELYGLTY